MSKVDKRTIEATYMNELVTKYAGIEPTVEQILKNYLSKQGYTDEDIMKIVEEEAFDNTVQAIKYGDYLSTTEEIMKKFASIEYKQMKDINNYYERVLSERYNITTVAIDVYEAIKPALDRLIKMNKVKKVDNPEHEGWYLYKYIG